MKLIRKEALIKLLKVEGNVLHIIPDGHKTLKATAHITNEKGETIAIVDYYSATNMIGLENINKLWQGQSLELTLMDLPVYVKRLERNKKRQKGIERNKRIKEAIEYFNGFWEGDNITITADFLDFAETLKELL